MGAYPQLRLSIPERAKIGNHGLLSIREQLHILHDEIVNQALLSAHGNQCRAALALGWHRNTLRCHIGSMAERGTLKASLKRSDYLGEKKAPQTAL